MTLIKKQKRFSGYAPYFIFGTTAVLTVGILIGIFAFLFIIGIQAFSSIGFAEFFLNSDWNPNSFHTPSWGIISMVVGTLIVSLLSLIFAVPSLPTIASISEDALSDVSSKFREASLALGATKWVTIKKIVIPAASSGLMAAIMLGLGRIIGETMIVLMVAGNTRAFPQSFLDSVRPMTANIAIEIKEVVTHSLHWQALFAIGLILFVITFIINFAADYFINKNKL